MVNPTVGPMIGPISQIITTDQILDKISDSFLDKMLMFSIMYAVFVLIIWWNSEKLIRNEDHDPTVYRFWRIWIYVNILTSLYFPLIMLGYRTGWFV